MHIELELYSRNVDIIIAMKNKTNQESLSDHAIEKKQVSVSVDGNTQKKALNLLEDNKCFFI